jgi:23S rRNA (guanosine2251-2'-O)-methyltransferase
MDELKKQGIWFYAAEMDGKTWCEQDFSGPCGLVIGSEGEGVSRLLLERCDFKVSLPMLGKVGSLNASVAGGILMYEIVRQRGEKSAK